MESGQKAPKRKAVTTILRKVAKVTIIYATQTQNSYIDHQFDHHPIKLMGKCCIDRYIFRICSRNFPPSFVFLQHPVLKVIKSMTPVRRHCRVGLALSRYRTFHVRREKDTLFLMQPHLIPSHIGLPKYRKSGHCFKLNRIFCTKTGHIGFSKK